MRSARLTAVAVTRMRTSAGPSAGAGTSPSWRTVSSPGSRITMARMSSAHHTIGPSWQHDAGVCIIARMSTLIGLVLVAGVAAVVWQLRARVRELDDRVGDLRLARHELERRVAEAELGLQVTRSHLADVAGGE